MQKKEKNIEEIGKQLNSFNPYLEIYSIINDYQHIQRKATITQTIQDTVIYKTEKKNFFKRLSEVFSPSDSFDSLVLVSKTTTDTITENQDETIRLLNDIQLSTEKGRQKYIQQIETFERKYNNLALADQEITKENVDKLHESTSVDELKFSNVWNRDTFYCHASFSDSPKQIIGINHDFWQTPSVFYEHSDNSNDFNIYFTTNTVNRILPRNGVMLIQLSYIFNYATSMLTYA